MTAEQIKQFIKLQESIEDVGMLSIAFRCKKEMEKFQQQFDDVEKTMKEMGWRCWIVRISYDIHMFLAEKDEKG